MTLDTRHYYRLLDRSAPQPTKRSGKEWLRCVDIFGSSLSSEFKNKFGILALDTIDGVRFENWGLPSLPNELILKIMGHLDARSALNLGECCARLSSVARTASLWQKMYLRYV